MAFYTVLKLMNNLQEKETVCGDYIAKPEHYTWKSMSTRAGVSLGQLQALFLATC